MKVCMSWPCCLFVDKWTHHFGPWTPECKCNILDTRPLSPIHLCTQTCAALWVPCSDGRCWFGHIHTLMSLTCCKYRINLHLCDSFPVWGEDLLTHPVALCWAWHIIILISHSLHYIAVMCRFTLLKLIVFDASVSCSWGDESLESC